MGEEDVMDDEREIQMCLYGDCQKPARRDGLCLKHLTALVKGHDPAAAAAARRFHQSHPAASEAEPLPPQAATTPTTETMMHKCKQCEKSFGTPHGLKIHVARNHRTPAAPPTASSPDPVATAAAGRMVVSDCHAGPISDSSSIAMTMDLVPAAPQKHPLPQAAAIAVARGVMNTLMLGCTMFDWHDGSHVLVATEIGRGVKILADGKVLPVAL